MENFDLRKYLQNNILLQEETNLRDLKEIKEFLIDAGYKRSEVNEWAREFSRDLQRGLITSEGQLKSLFERWLDTGTTYTSLQDGLKALRDSNQSVPSSVKVDDTEVKTEPFDGNIVKVVEPKNPSATEPVEVTNEKIVLPFLKKVEGELASIWNDDIKGFFQEDLKKIFKKIFNSESRAAKRLAKELEKAAKEQQSKEVQDYDPDMVRQSDAAAEASREAMSDMNRLVPSDAPKDMIVAAKVEYKKLLSKYMEEHIPRLLDKDIVDGWKAAVDNVNAPGIKSLVIKDASGGAAGLHNLFFIDGPVAKFLSTYDEYIDKGVFFYQNYKGEWKHNTVKVKSNFFKYVNEELEKHDMNPYKWDEALPEGVKFEDIGGIDVAPEDDVDTDTGADIEPDDSIADKVLDILSDIF